MKKAMRVMVTVLAAALVSLYVAGCGQNKEAAAEHPKGEHPKGEHPAKTTPKVELPKVETPATNAPKADAEG